MIAFLLMFKRLSIKLFIGFTAGFLMVVVIFTLSGYYFWLTVLTGKVYAQVYIESIVLYTFAQQMQKMMYFGFPLILIVLFLIYRLITDFRTIQYPYVAIPFITGAIIYVLSTWEVGAFNRYLYVYAPALFPLMFYAIKDIEFSKRDVIVVPIAGAALLGMILYF